MINMVIIAMDIIAKKAKNALLESVQEDSVQVIQQVIGGYT